MTIEVARRYRFGGRHHVPGLPEPWCTPHHHLYTVEFVARGEGSIVVDTDLIDHVWYTELSPKGSDGSWNPGVDMDAIYGAENTTVEALSAYYLKQMAGVVPEVKQVVVWEDEARWGSAQINQEKIMDRKGYYDKYQVIRRDTGEEVSCFKFTLVPSRDRHAATAVLAYAEAIAAENPELAADLRAQLASGA